MYRNLAPFARSFAAGREISGAGAGGQATPDSTTRGLGSARASILAATECYLRMLPSGSASLAQLEVVIPPTSHAERALWL